MNDLELTSALRESGSTMAIVLMTGHVCSQLQAEAMRAGADLVVGKQLASRMLLDEIARMTA